MVRAAVDSEGIDIDVAAVGLPLTQRRPGWPARIFNKVLELHLQEPGDIAKRETLEIDTDKMRAQINRENARQ